uniref:Secreted protein n=1 Tax=Ixodes ricinus TaxID=34613 RepID=A0A6B0UU99_IXORI
MCALLGRGLLCFSFLSLISLRAARDPGIKLCRAKKEKKLLFVFFFSLNSVDFFFCRLSQAVLLCLGESFTAYLFYLLARDAQTQNQTALCKKKKKAFFLWIFFCRLLQAVLFRFAEARASRHLFLNSLRATRNPKSRL